MPDVGVNWGELPRGSQLSLAPGVLSLFLATLITTSSFCSHIHDEGCNMLQPTDTHTHGPGMPLATVSLSPRRCRLRPPIPHRFPAVKGAGAALHPSTQVIPCSPRSTLNPFRTSSATTGVNLALCPNTAVGRLLKRADHTRGQCLRGRCR